MERSMERWKRLAILVALLTAGAVVIALYAQFQQLSCIRSPSSARSCWP